MKKILLALITSGLLLGCVEKNNVTAEQVKSSLIKSIPGLPSDVKITKSPINDIYEVSVGRKVFYVSEDGKYLIFGNIINAATKENLTDKRTQELSKINWNQLPLDLAIKVVNGNGEHKIAVFSDPDCPYCRMFEQQTVPQLKNTTIYTFLFPLPIHPTAREHSEKIWCSKDRAATWTAWMVNKTPLPENTKCDTYGLDKIYKVGTDLVQIEATPTIILDNGQLLAGALPAEQLMTMMDEANGKTVKDTVKQEASATVDASSTK